jgi:hypothetical protein
MQRLWRMWRIEWNTKSISYVFSMSSVGSNPTHGGNHDPQALNFEGDNGLGGHLKTGQ